MRHDYMRNTLRTALVHKAVISRTFWAVTHVRRGGKVEIRPGMKELELIPLQLPRTLVQLALSLTKFIFLLFELQLSQLFDALLPFAYLVLVDMHVTCCLMH